jgi:hypothetical protein
VLIAAIVDFPFRLKNRFIEMIPRVRAGDGRRARVHVVDTAAAAPLIRWSNVRARRIRIQCKRSRAGHPPAPPSRRQTFLDA